MDIFSNFEEEIGAFTEELNMYLMEKFSYRKRPISLPLNNTICAKRRAFDLYFRYKPDEESCWGKDRTLVIARIGFDKQRQGQGTELLRLLVNVGDRYDYSRIGIESTSTVMITNFAKKYGFRHHNYEKNWIAELSVIKGHL